MAEFLRFFSFSVLTLFFPILSKGIQRNTYISFIYGSPSSKRKKDFITRFTFMDETFCPRSLKTLSVTNLLRLSRWQKKKVQHRFLRKTKQNHFLINLFSFPEAFSYHVISHNVCGEFKMYLAIIHRIIRMKIKGTDMHLSLSVCGSLCREASVFLKRGPQRIGSTYKKAVYKQYTDATYRVEVTKSDWLGYLGPLLMAEEGDTVVVHLKNAASRPYSIHPHGLNYSKGNEGKGTNEPPPRKKSHPCAGRWTDPCVCLLRSPVPRRHRSRAEARRLGGARYVGDIRVDLLRVQQPNVRGQQLSDQILPLPRRRSEGHQHGTHRTPHPL